VIKKALTLTIVIPVYNEEGYLKACLDTISEQTELPDEVIVVDNNSTDKSAEIAKLYTFVKVIKEKQSGVFYARNRGFNEAKSDIIGRIDGDTLLPDNWVANVKKIFESGEYSAVSGPVSYYDMPLEPLSFHVDVTIRSLISKTNETKFLFGTNMAITKKSWRAVKNKLCADRDIHEDLDLAVHLQRIKEPIGYVPTLRARMSARRFDDTPPAFYRYLKMHRTTFERHKIRSGLPYIATAIYLIAYFILKPIRRSYDKQSNKFTLKHFIFGYHKPRKNPMS